MQPRSARLATIGGHRDRQGRYDDRGGRAYVNERVAPLAQKGYLSRLVLAATLRLRLRESGKGYCEHKQDPLPDPACISGKGI